MYQVVWSHNRLFHLHTPSQVSYEARLRFRLTNSGPSPVSLDGVVLPIEFNGGVNDDVSDESPTGYLRTLCVGGRVEGDSAEADPDDVRPAPAV